MNENISVTVLMSTYNGDCYLAEQIDSLLAQDGVEVNILVRDDGSTDRTTSMLEEYQNEGILQWYSGPNLRSAKSFLDLVKVAPATKYYAFCDQDDVWKTDKLKRAVDALEQHDNTIPLLYCSNYQLVDADLNPLPDNGHVSTTTFNAALVSSCCTGCTVVFNHVLRDYLNMGTPQHIVMHDDWAHKVCLALGGKVIYDDAKTLYYRQHGNNVDGGVHSSAHKFYGIIRRLFVKDKTRSRQLQEITRIYASVLSDDNLKLLRFVSKEDKNLAERLTLVRNTSLKTPYQRLNRGFDLAILLNYF